jgi:transcriptional regulator with XRE-family HTH domain
MRLAEEFSAWLIEQIEECGWSQSELGRRAGLGNATVSRIVSDMRAPGPDVCLAIARALREPPEKIFCLAGILPPVPGEQCREFKEVSEMLACLPDSTYQQTMLAIRALARDACERALEESGMKTQ